MTTFHMDHDVAKKGTAGPITLKAVFGLAMRDRHRVFAGDFNQAHHYIRVQDLVASLASGYFILGGASPRWGDGQPPLRCFKF